MSKKQIYNRYKPKPTASQKKKDLGEKELYLTAKKPWNNYISLETITPETSFFDN